MILRPLAVPAAARLPAGPYPVALIAPEAHRDGDMPRACAGPGRPGTCIVAALFAGAVRGTSRSLGWASAGSHATLLVEETGALDPNGEDPVVIHAMRPRLRSTR